MLFVSDLGTGAGFVYAMSVVVIPMVFEQNRALACGLSMTGTGFGMKHWLFKTLGSNYANNL